MNLSTLEMRAATYAGELLEDRQHSASIVPPYQVGLLRTLSDSPIEDLGLLTCYVADRLDDSVPLDWLAHTPTSAFNLARMLDTNGDLAQRLRAGNAPDLTNALIALGQTSLAGPFLSTSTRVKSQTLIVHGTWANKSDWWQPHGSFFKYVDNVTGNVYRGPSPFWWSGRNSHDHRVSAARDLVRWTRNNPADHLTVIAHSHGGNVCLHAATRLKLKIDRLILLGTPIRLEYMHSTSTIGKLHNVFSLGDYVQRPAGTVPNPRGEGRTLTENAYTQNHIAEDDGSKHAPGHGELHEEATWKASGLENLIR